MLVRRRGPRRIPGPRRPHPCGKDIMIFSLVDFMGYAMTVISGVEHLNIDSERYSVSFRKEIKLVKPLSAKPKKQKRPI